MPNSRLTIHHTLSTEHLSNEIKVLIACCQAEPSEEDIHFISSYLSTEHLELHPLISLANQHGVLPLVYKTLKNLQPVTLDSIGDPQSQSDNSSSSHNTSYVTHSTLEYLLTDLKSTYTQIARRNMLMSAELIKIMHLLKDNHIEALAFKGPSLAQMAYSDLTLRQFSDLDILIKTKDRFKMMELLLKEHYIPEINFKKGTKETFFNSVNVIGFHNPSIGVLIEVHWELLSRNYAINWKEKSLWNRQEHVLINNKKIPVLVFEQQLLYLCVHGAKHLFERLEWISDINRSIRSNPNIDWQYLLNEAEKLGIKRMLYLGLTLSELFFELELPQMIKKNITQDKEIPQLISKVIEINFSKTFQKGKSFGTFGLLLSMRENLSDKLRFTYSGLFAPKFDDFAYLQLPKYLAFLYPVVRLYRLMKKYFQH